MPKNDSLVCVDDTDPAIKWDESWFSAQGNTDEWGDQGPPFLSTLQAITRNGSFSYSYRGMLLLSVGRNVYVLGALRPRNISVGSGHDPDWECFLDGVKMVQQFPYPTVPSSNFPLCYGGENTADQDHTIELRAIVHEETLYVDQVQYRGLVDTDNSTDWTEVRHKDGRFKFSNDWQEREGGYGTETTVNGAWFTYEFYGQGAILGGYTPGVNVSAFTNGSATYSLDNAPPIAFAIPATAVNKSYQSYFSITDLEPGQHRLEVINQGNELTPPLAFSYIYTKNAPQRPVKPRKGGKVVGGAVGGGLGGAVILAVTLFVCIVFIRKRRRRRAEHTVLEPSIDHGVVHKDYTGPPGACYMEVNPGPGRALGPQPPAFLDQSPHALLPQTTSVPRSSLRQPPAQSMLPLYEDVHPHPLPTSSEKVQSRKAHLVPSTNDLTPAIPLAQSTTSQSSKPANAGLLETTAGGDEIVSNVLHKLHTMDGKADETIAGGDDIVSNVLHKLHTMDGKADEHDPLPEYSKVSKLL